jgi:acyl-coenzyme A synthetase/AMP-(fatty) acid ligase
MVVEDEELGVSSVTYEALAESTSRFAEFLRRLGLLPGNRVLIRLGNSLSFPAAFLGTLKAGLIGVPASTMLTATELEFMAADSGAAALVIDKKSWHMYAPRLSLIPSLKHVLLVGKGEVYEGKEVTTHDVELALLNITSWSPPHQTAADDPAYLVYTSGTSGFPKGVLHAHRSLIGRTPAAQYWFDFNSQDDRILHSGKFNWSYVLGTALMDPLYWGKTVIAFEGRPNADTWPKLIAKHEATIFIGVPTIFRKIIQQTSWDGKDLPTLRHCMTAGEPLSKQLLTNWRKRFGVEIYEALGMTEFSYYVSQSKAHPIRPGSVGLPQPGHFICLMNPETMEPVGPNEEGMICVPRDDPALFLSYWNRPTDISHAFRNGWFATGDFARCDEDGYIWYRGRKDDLINSFGNRISPYEVEAVLKSHPAVDDCACISETVSPEKVLVVAYVSLHYESPTVLEELLALGNERLAQYKAPRIIYLTHEFPRTNNGKILRKQIDPSLASAKFSSREIV